MSSIIQHSLFDMKRCAGCGAVKDLSEFYACKSHSDGKGAYCKPCDKQKSQQFREKNRDKLKAYQREYYLANKDEHRVRGHAYYFANRDRWREYARDWYMKNRERYLIKFRKYRQDNPDYFREYDRIYYSLNKNRLNAQNREAYARNKAERSIKSHQWRRLNRAKCNELWQRRRARLKGAAGSHTAGEWAALLAWFGGVCLCCGSHDDLTADHVTPLIKGGSNSIENLQPLCRSCNSTKHTQTIDYRDPERLAALLTSYSAVP